MSVEAGQTLGKYQLIEKVGQGGMAVVYRGRDTSLKREVAVKVLHNHLAEHTEARERFGREAHAVAKLKHENILEIHDFSGLDSPESFIVTEFIDGCTLKEFIGEHPLLFPELGAMIVTQVCGALAHAHGLGVLHRDVKPENIMIRNDGVVKLTDFGIAQMIDLQRMTVTGQLLGSPAYMAPEHVIGGMLDFRTDVFALGIVLYQLVTGELPFHGKNPHEILKRIADCEYPDPARKNPRVGKELGGIIRTALQKSPDDRYADISLMQQDLETYLEGSGLANGREELERFFDAPAAYQMALEQRLVDHLTERARGLLASDRITALELYNRVLSIDENNSEVLAQLSQLGSRQRNLKLAGIVLAVAALGGLAVLAKSRFAARPELAADAGVFDATTSDAANPVLYDAAPPDASQPDARARADASPSPADAREAAPLVRRRRPDAGTITAPRPKRRFTLDIARRNSKYRVDDGPWKDAPSGRAEIALGEGEHRVVVANDCCEETSKAISPELPGGILRFRLKGLPGSVTATCKTPGVRVEFGGKPWHLGRPFPVPMVGITGAAFVKVEFFSPSRTDKQTIRVPAKTAVEVPCKL